MNTSAALKVGGSGYAALSKEIVTKTFRIPFVKANPTNIQRFGKILTSKEQVLSEYYSVTWRKLDGWRGISEGTGNEEPPATGEFDHFWKGNICMAKNGTNYQRPGIPI